KSEYILINNKIMANITANELFEKIINEGSQIINKYDFNLFSNFEKIAKIPFGAVCTAKWKDSTIVLKSLNIDADEIISNGIIADFKLITIPNEAIKAISNETITNDGINSEITNETSIRAFINELQNLAKIDKHKHPNIIQFYGVTKADDMTLFVDKLSSTFSKLFNKGRSVSDIIISSISEDLKTDEEVFNWLFAHKYNPKYTCLLGLFYSWEIGTKNENVDVFSLFLKAANSNDIFAQYFVGQCYETGWNIRKNMKQAIKWYTKASEGGCTIAEYMLGEYYYKLNKYKKAINYLKSAADKGNALAMNTLGICYQKGYGTNVDKVKGFKLFEKAAKEGLPASQYELGDCYEYGNGTKINLRKSLDWYKEASEKNPNYRIHAIRVRNRLNNKKQK
ncbi:15864_t:CDS:2, partial [Dentiscutata erythropus]